MSKIPLNDQSLLAVMKIIEALKTKDDDSYDSQITILERAWNDLILKMKLEFDPELSNYLDAVNAQRDFTKSLSDIRLNGVATELTIEEINQEISNRKVQYDQAKASLANRLK